MSRWNSAKPTLRRLPAASLTSSGEPLALAVGLHCGTLPRLPGAPRGMLSADSGVVTEMPDGPRDDDLMIVPAGGIETSLV